MAATMLMLINFNLTMQEPLLKFISTNIIEAISWPPPFTSQLFSPRPYLFSQLGCFCVDIVIANSKASLWLVLILLFKFFPLYNRNRQRLCGFMCLQRTEIRRRIYPNDSWADSTQEWEMSYSE